LNFNKKPIQNFINNWLFGLVDFRPGEPKDQNVTERSGRYSDKVLKTTVKDQWAPKGEGDDIQHYAGSRDNMPQDKFPV
jgi:hypothetical protein